MTWLRCLEPEKLEYGLISMDISRFKLTTPEPLYGAVISVSLVSTYDEGRSTFCIKCIVDWNLGFFRFFLEGHDIGQIYGQDLKNREFLWTVQTVVLSYLCHFIYQMVSCKIVGACQQPNIVGYVGEPHMAICKSLFNRCLFTDWVVLRIGHLPPHFLNPIK